MVEVVFMAVRASLGNNERQVRSILFVGQFPAVAISRLKR